MQVCDRFSDRHAAGLAVRNAGGEGGSQRVHIEGDIAGAGEFHAVEGGQVAHLDDFDVELPGLLALMPSDSTNSDLDQTLGQSFLHDASKRASMRYPVVFEFVVKIGVGVEVEGGKSLTAPAEGGNDGQGNRVVATEAYRTTALVQQFADFPF